MPMPPNVQLNLLRACIFALGLVTFESLSAQVVSISTTFEGANPSEAQSVTRQGDRRFLLRPFNEQGSNEAYYFRFSTMLINSSDRELDVELAVEWPALKNNPDFPYDTYFYGDDNGWQWCYGSVDGLLARLVVPCKPGTTYVGYYPRYSYSRSEAFVEGLRAKGESGRVMVSLAGLSGQSRNIHVVRVTGPQAAQVAKKRVLVTARNHPYETSGSFIVEEMISYLLGDGEGVARLLDETEFYFVPMMNPDGVATGCNQRTRPTGGVNMSYGADSDDPAVTVLLALVDSIEPQLWADVHSWPHKGDDGMWSTHQWLAKGLLEQMPEGSFNDYTWNVSFVQERKTARNHLWQWLIRTHDGSGGVSFSFSWFRRTEQDLNHIGRKLVHALASVAGQR